MDNQDLHRRVSAVEHEQNTMKVTLAKVEAALASQNDTLDAILNWVKWGVRVILGGIVVATITAVYGLVMKGHG